MMQPQHVIAGSTVALLFALGASSAVFGACSPNDGSGDAGVGADVIVCDPTSSDPVGCACDPSKTPQVDCYSGPPGTSSKGICHAGIRKCNPDGTWSECLGEVTPQPEVCNLADDDCDGVSDDLFNDAAAISHCTSPACADFADAAITCWGPSNGICGAGTLACAPGPKGGMTGCSEFIHVGAQEVCNGIDDDCNGTIDDGLDQEGPCDMDAGSAWPDDANPFEAGDDGGRVTRILGECVHGNLTCVSSNCDKHGCKNAGDQCFPSQPTPEICDGKDNDCNGVIDEHSCATTNDVLFGETFCCRFGNSTPFCAPSSYTQFGYTCFDAGP